MKFSLIFILVFWLAACSSTSTTEQKTAANAPTAAPSRLQAISSDLPDLGQAPELTNEIWLNTKQPLRLADLRGQVVLLDMWTFG